MEKDELKENTEQTAQEKCEKAECKEKKKTGKKLQEELEKALAEAEESKRKWYAVTAEYDNYRKRTAMTASQKYAEGVADVLIKIMPIGDNIDRALAVCNDEKMKQGLEMVKAAFDKILSDEGVEAFDPTGEEFNPVTANAVMAQPAAEGEKAGVVKQTFLKGYKKGDKILRFAQVVVTQ